jgi:muconate cycloisomerase
MLHCSVRAHPGGNVSIPFKGAVMQRSTADFSSLRASTLKIEAVQNLHRRSPYHPAAPLIRRDDAGADVDVVKVICSDGITGLGEGTTIGGLSYGAESPEGMKLAIDQYIAPILKSASPARVPETMIAIRKAIKGNNFAKCAVETALLDAWGKRVGLPVSELVGGRLRDRLPVAWTLASGDTAVDIAEAEQMLERKRHNASSSKSAGGRSTRTLHTWRRSNARLATLPACESTSTWHGARSKRIRGLPPSKLPGCDIAEQPVESPAALARLAQMYRGSDTSAKTRIGQLISGAEPFDPSMGRTTGRKTSVPQKRVRTD